MLGHRGDRLAITYPEILEMQVRAIIEAAVECKKQRIAVLPEIMIPLAGTKAELDFLKKFTVDTANAVFAEQKTTVDYLYGTMIEVPRAAVTADELAQTAEFFSFGTNDLTQMTFGYSRDDAGSFLPEYVKKEILERDPFQSLDVGGVGKLIEMAVNSAAETRNDLKCGICGEHGGDPQVGRFCHTVGLNYVSCSPFRVPIARLAAAHAAIKGPAGSHTGAAKSAPAKAAAKPTPKPAAKSKPPAKPVNKRSLRACVKRLWNCEKRIGWPLPRGQPFLMERE